MPKAKTVKPKPSKVPAKSTNKTSSNPKYTSADDMQAKCDEYFALCKAGQKVKRFIKGKVVTIVEQIPCTQVGLALHLGFASRQSLADYNKRSKPFSFVITRAKAKIEEDLVLGGITGRYESKLTHLVLATNYDYSTKTEQDIKHSGSLDVKLVDSFSPGDVKGSQVKDLQAKQHKPRPGGSGKAK